MKVGQKRRLKANRKPQECFKPRFLLTFLKIWYILHHTSPRFNSKGRVRSLHASLCWPVCVFREKESSSSPLIREEREILNCTMTWILKSYSEAPVMNNRSILARLARLIICSVHMHLRRFSYFSCFTKGSRIRFCLQSSRLHVSTRRKKTFFSALLMINVLIFLDMVWFGFWYSPTTMHLGHF